MSMWGRSGGGSRCGSSAAPQRVRVSIPSLVCVGTMFESPCGGPCGVFEGPWRPCRGLFSEFSSTRKGIHAHFDESRLCEKMRTVFAVILHPTRAFFESIRQSCDHFSVNAAQNPQTETAFLARNSIKGRCSPFYRAHHDYHTRPFLVCKA